MPTTQYILFFCLLGATPMAYGGVELELLPLDYTTATAIPDQSHIYDLYHSPRQCWILNPLNEARDWTHVLMGPSQVHYHWAATGTPTIPFYTWGAAGLHEYPKLHRSEVLEPDFWAKVGWLQSLHAWPTYLNNWVTLSVKKKCYLLLYFGPS